MAFPSDIETGIGLAGPTADIGHADAHAANGIPRLLEELQTSVGVNRTPTAWTPTFNQTTQPSTIDAAWGKYGPLVWFSVYALWTSSSGGLTTGNTLRINGGFPAWGSITGAPWYVWLNAEGGYHGIAFKSATYIAFYTAQNIGTIVSVPANQSIAIDGFFWTS